MSLPDFFFAAEDASAQGILGWMPLWEEALPDEACITAADELGVDPTTIKVTLVLMRLESQVEVDINGHEYRLWVECTKRARSPEPYWRVERSDG